MRIIKQLIAVLLLSVLASTAWSWTGSGTSADPYLINSLSDLETLRDNVNMGTSYAGQFFKQTKDIEMNSTNWIPIGTGSNPFMGSYNGKKFINK